jgi:hypothetical protein
MGTAKVMLVAVPVVIPIPVPMLDTVAIPIMAPIVSVTLSNSRADRQCDC